MKNKILSLSVLIFSLFIFSACTLNNQNKTQPSANITPVVQETSDDTEAELQKQLNADTDTNYDSDLNNLQTELAK